jgi:hypothetical protein
MKKDSCIFYRSFYDSIKTLPATKQLSVYNALFGYFFEEKEIELKGLPQTIASIIKPLLNTGETNNKDIYIARDHLSITWDEMNKLIDAYGEEKADEYVKRVLNYRKNTKYKSLYLTALKWIKLDEKRNIERISPKLSI